MPNFVFIGSGILAFVAVIGCFVWACVCYGELRKAASDRQSIIRQPEYRKARRRLWLSCAALATIVGMSVYGFVAFWLPWDSARSLAARIQFVRETFVKKTGAAPDEVVLERSDAVRDGESNLYVGVAKVKGETWDVRVWNGNHELRMEAKKR